MYLGEARGTVLVMTNLEVCTHFKLFKYFIGEWHNPSKETQRPKEPKIFENTNYKGRMERGGKSDKGPTGRVEGLKQWGNEFTNAYKQSKHEDGKVGSIQSEQYLLCRSRVLENRLLVHNKHLVMLGIMVHQVACSVLKYKTVRKI